MPDKRATYDLSVRRCTAPEEMTRIVEGLIAAQRSLAALSVFDIVEGIDAAIRLLRFDPQFDPQFDPIVSSLTRTALIQLLEEELGDPALLDDFRPKPCGSGRYGRVRAFGPRLIMHILPGNIPDVALISIVSALLVKSACLARVDDAILARCAPFLQALSETQPILAACCAWVAWGGEAVSITKAAFEKAEVAVVYGSDETIAAIRPLIPQQTRTLFHGHKVSFGIIARECISPKIVAAAASDIIAHDQRGCLSPHLYYVESGGPISPLTAAAWLAEALEAACQAHPVPPDFVSPAEAARIWQWRGSLPLKGGHVFQSPHGVDWTVLYDPDPVFSLSPLGRTVWVKPIDDLRQIPAHIAPMRPWLQAAGVAIPSVRISEIVTAVADVGVGRICPMGSMQQPPLTWHHDGRFRLLDLLRFVDWESGRAL